MSIDSLQQLLVEQLEDLYDAETRLTKALPNLAQRATNADLKQALDDHLTETLEQVQRLEQCFEALGAPARGKACAGMRGIIDESTEHAGEDYGGDDLRDLVIIGSAQRAEHYEIAAYRTAAAHARLLDRTDVVSLLEDTLDEEKAADMKLTELAATVIYPDPHPGYR